jgi:hypothetical protein
MHEGRPARFGWRGRLYTVLAVIARPEELAGTTESPAAGPGSAAEAEHEAEHGAEAERGAGQRWRCWQVSASPGLSVPADVYRLCQDAVTGRWTMSRASA